MSTVPQKAWHHSGLLADRTATRSPFCTPRSASVWLTELAAERNAVKPMRRSP